MRLRVGLCVGGLVKLYGLRGLGCSTLLLYLLKKSLILIVEELDTNQLAAFQGNANLTCSFISLLIFDYH